MTNPNILQVLSESVADNRSEKLCIIEDIIKAKKLLFGFGYKEHNEFTIPLALGKLFDDLYELNIDDLQTKYKELENSINNHIKN